jgi:hypothetical protein
MFCGAHQPKHRSEKLIGDDFWKNSPSPEPDDEKGEENQEWEMEVVGEEVDNTGEVRCADSIDIPGPKIDNPDQMLRYSYEVSPEPLQPCAFSN